MPTEELLTEDSLYEIYSEHFSKLCLYARGFTYNDSDAQDLVQDAFCRVFEAVGKKKVANKYPLAYIYKVIRNLAINKGAKARNWQNKAIELSNRMSEKTEFEPMLLDRILFEQILQYIETEHTALEAELFNLRFCDDLTLDEIKKITGKSLGTLSRLFNTILQKIEKKFNFEV